MDTAKLIPEIAAQHVMHLIQKRLTQQHEIELANWTQKKTCWIRKWEL